MQQPVEGKIKLDSGSLIKQNPKTASLMGAPWGRETGCSFPAWKESRHQPALASRELMSQSETDNKSADTCAVSRSGMPRGPQPSSRVTGSGLGWRVLLPEGTPEQSLECSEESVHVGIGKDKGLCKGPGRPGWPHGQSPVPQ